MRKGLLVLKAKLPSALTSKGSKLISRRKVVVVGADEPSKPKSISYFVKIGLASSRLISFELRSTMI